MIKGPHPLSVFTSKITYYSPEIFQTFIDKDYPEVNPLESFDIIKNKELILKFATGPNGGKSGEFFFFSSDKKLLLKTMKWEEVVAIRKRLQSYGNYLIDQPNSMISKIFGLFSITRLGIEAD